MLLEAAVIGGLGLNALAGFMNYKAQKDNLRYSKDLQRDIFEREDTSIARRVEDLKRSGLSPVLAAGQGAGTGAVVSTKAPEFSDLSSSIMMAANLMKMEADISATYAQKDLLEMQKNRIGALLPEEVKNMQANTSSLSANASRTYQESRKAKVEADNVVRTGVSGNNTYSQAYRDFGGAIDKVSQKANELVQKSRGVPKKPNLTPTQVKEVKKNSNDTLKKLNLKELNPYEPIKNGSFNYSPY